MYTFLLIVILSACRFAPVLCLETTEGRFGMAPLWIAAIGKERGWTGCTGECRLCAAHVGFEQNGPWPRAWHHAHQGQWHLPISSGSFAWENRLIDGVWTYAQEEAEAGLQACFATLKSDFERNFGRKLRTVGAIGISGMMHDYLPFDREGRQLAAFRTWRNTMTGEAAARLSELFGFNIPQHWSAIFTGG